MLTAKIYRPSRSAMQSGRAHVEGDWVLECETPTARRPESLMGWTSSCDTLNQVMLHFPSQEEAIRFAQDKGWAYTVLPEHERIVKPRNYVDNFKYIPPEEDKPEEAAEREWSRSSTG